MRRYSLRQIDPATGEVDTLGEFQEHATRLAALTAAARWARKIGERTMKKRLLVALVLAAGFSGCKKQQPDAEAVVEVKGPPTAEELRSFCLEKNEVYGAEWVERCRCAFLVQRPTYPKVTSHSQALCMEVAGPQLFGSMYERLDPMSFDMETDRTSPEECHDLHRLCEKNAKDLADDAKQLQECATYQKLSGDCTDPGFRKKNQRDCRDAHNAAEGVCSASSVKYREDKYVKPHTELASVCRRLAAGEGVQGHYCSPPKQQRVDASKTL